MRRQIMRSVVLLSGGLDSAVVLYQAVAAGDEVRALTIRYGQRHSYEIECAARLAASLPVREHKVIDLDLAAFGGSALTDPSVAVPTERTSGIPATYVPARNTIFLSLALAYAEVTDSDRILAGFNAVDYSGYPDCRPEYLECFQSLAMLATKKTVEGSPIRVEAPLIRMGKAEIVSLGTSLGVNFHLTSSCYQPVGGKPCGVCDSCVIRDAGMAGRS